MDKYREIEHKYSSNQTHNATRKHIQAQLGAPFQTGHSIDYYWNSAAADFVRLRVNKVGSKTITLTVKHTDAGSTEDRKEVNLDVSAVSLKDTLEFLNTSLGEPVLKFKQHYALYQAGRSTIVSVYTVDMSPLVFVEIESGTLKELEKWDFLCDGYTRLNYSLWQLLRPRKTVAHG